MKTIKSILFIMMAIIPFTDAEILLGQPEERVLLLVDLPTAKLDDKSLSLLYDATLYQFVLSRSFLQMMIFGPPFSMETSGHDAKGAEMRLSELERLIEKKSQGLILVELVLTKKSPHWLVSYIKVFDTIVEYPRYFPKLESKDGILLPKGFIANSPAEFQQKLLEMNAASWQKIKEKSQQAAPFNR